MYFNLFILKVDVISYDVILLMSLDRTVKWIDKTGIRTFI